MALANSPKSGSPSTGDFEIEYTEVDEEFYIEVMKTCRKHGRNHKQVFIPFLELKLDQLPDSIRTEDVLKMIQLWGDLTVRICVNRAYSPDRPDAGEDIGKCLANAARKGSGMLLSVFFQDSVCVCKSCEGSKEPHQKWAALCVRSVSHHVFDEFELRGTEVDFFYDQDQPRAKKGEGVVTVYPIDNESLSLSSCQFKRENDFTKFYCSTHDMDFAKRMQKRLKESHDQTALAMKGNLNAMDCIVVSHPHGCGKRVSFGSIHEAEVKDLAGGDKALTYICYTSPTCKGSSGGLVLWRDKLFNHAGCKTRLGETFINQSARKPELILASNLENVKVTTFEDAPSNHFQGAITPATYQLLSNELESMMGKFMTTIHGGTNETKAKESSGLLDGFDSDTIAHFAHKLKLDWEERHTGQALGLDPQLKTDSDKGQPGQDHGLDPQLKTDSHKGQPGQDHGLDPQLKTDTDKGQSGQDHGLDPQLKSDSDKRQSGQDQDHGLDEPQVSTPSELLSMDLSALANTAVQNSKLNFNSEAGFKVFPQFALDVDKMSPGSRTLQNRLTAGELQEDDIEIYLHEMKSYLKQLADHACQTPGASAQRGQTSPNQDITAAQTGQISTNQDRDKAHTGKGVTNQDRDTAQVDTHQDRDMAHTGQVDTAHTGQMNTNQDRDTAHTAQGDTNQDKGEIEKENGRLQSKPNTGKEPSSKSEDVCNKQTMEPPLD